MPPQKSTIIAILALATAAVVGSGTYWYSSHVGRFVPSPMPADADSALIALRDGNARFVRSARTLSADTAHDAEHRRETAKEQHPFAAVLCCADSRICPEFIFDQRSGSMFEIRNAGNVVDEDVLASMEYAVEHFHVPVVVVLAHKRCGAIKAVGEAGDKPLHDHLQELQKHMAGIRQQVISHHGDATLDWLDQLSTENARQQALSLLHDSPIIKAAVDHHETRLMYAIYDMESGAVEFFDVGS